MLGYYNYTVILTYIGMSTAFAGILMAADGSISGAVVCLMLAGVCDMFDGPVARTRVRIKEEKRFGIQIDSLSDLIGFGILPGIILYRIAGQSMAGILVSAVYVLCALIRLAYFNVVEEKRQDETDEHRSCYEGLPVTLSAVFIPLVYLIQDMAGIQRGKAMVVLMALMAMAFLAPVKLGKPQSLGRIILSVLGVFGLVLLAGGST